MKHSYSILLLFLSFLLNAHAQQKGTYLTLDQTKEITFLDSNKIFIKETNFKRNFEEIIITGTYRRKLKKLLVYPDAYLVDSKADDANKPQQIIYRIKHVTGHKFLIKRFDTKEVYQEYCLMLYP